MVKDGGEGVGRQILKGGRKRRRRRRRGRRRRRRRSRRRRKKREDDEEEGKKEDEEEERDCGYLSHAFSPTAHLRHNLQLQTVCLQTGASVRWKDMKVYILYMRGWVYMRG